MPSRTPRILISAARPEPDAAARYAAAILAAGGDPVVRYAPELDLAFDGLLLTGGGDIDPALYGQTPAGSDAPDPRRDAAEFSLLRAFLAAAKPILGVCRGHQVINAALGGTLIQDLGARLNPLHRHSASGDRVHLIRALPGSILSRLYGGAPFPVNSAHHQAVDAPGRDLLVTARSEHGVAEGIELPGRPLLGVQFHPERMTGTARRPDCADGGEVFRWFLAQCR